jgi:hypothetical protein
MPSIEIDLPLTPMNLIRFAQNWNNGMMEHWVLVRWGNSLSAQTILRRRSKKDVFLF